MNIKKTLISAAALCLLSSNVFAATIAPDVFTQKAEQAGLKVGNYKATDVMGNQNKGIRVKAGTKRFPGITSFSIFCTNNLENSELFMVIEANIDTPKGPAPKTLVVNDSGKRIDIPITNYEWNGHRASIIGPWAQFTVSVPLSALKAAGVKSIKGLSVIMTNPDSGADGGFVTVLATKQEKLVNETSGVYTFYLNLSR